MDTCFNHARRRAPYRLTLRAENTTTETFETLSDISLCGHCINEFRALNGTLIDHRTGCIPNPDLRRA